MLGSDQDKVHVCLCAFDLYDCFRVLQNGGAASPSSPKPTDLARRMRSPVGLKREKGKGDGRGYQKKQQKQHRRTKDVKDRQ